MIFKRCENRVFTTVSRIYTDYLLKSPLKLRFFYALSEFSSARHILPLRNFLPSLISKFCPSQKNPLLSPKFCLSRARLFPLLPYINFFCGGGSADFCPRIFFARLSLFFGVGGSGCLSEFIGIFLLRDFCFFLLQYFPILNLSCFPQCSPWNISSPPPLSMLRLPELFHVEQPDFFRLAVGARSGGSGYRSCVTLLAGGGRARYFVGGGRSAVAKSRYFLGAFVGSLYWPGSVGGCESVFLSVMIFCVLSRLFRERLAPRDGTTRPAERISPRPCAPNRTSRANPVIE